MSRVLVSQVAACLGCLLTTGCITPIALGPDGTMAVGLYRVQHLTPNPSVSYASIKGIGWAARRGAMSLGYQDWTIMNARLDDSYSVTTPAIRFAVGADAQGPVGWSLVLKPDPEKGTKK